jgi:photosystem II stability/assembly factor-like uncharacterized protein
LPSGIIGKIGVAASSDSNRVFAMVEAEDGGLFRSEDAGVTWTRVNEDRRLRQRAFYYSRVYTDPKDREVVYVLNTSFFRSSDGGKTFRTIRTPHGDNHDLWIASNDPKRMINSNDGGGNVSINGGESWTGQAYPTAQLYHVATTHELPYQVCGAQQDNSTVCVASLDSGRGGGGGGVRVNPLMYAVGGGESGYIAPHPTDPNLFYAGSQGALLTRFDRRTGATRDIQVYPLFFSGMPAKDLKERWQWTFPIVFSPLDPKVIYTSSQHLWRTTNDGQSWERISPDLTRADPKTLGDSGGPITKDQNGPEIFGTIFTIAPSRFEKDTIWTGSDDGRAFITRDGGKNWKEITPPGLPEFARISLIEASPHKKATAYLAAKRYQLDDRKPYLYRTDDYGTTWTAIVNGIGTGDFVHAVREDTKRSGLLYAGTEHGIYVSFDHGARWQSLRLNLPDTQVPDMVVEEHDLVIATHGRSFYILDDIGSLRQMAPEVSRESVHLFQPRTVLRGLNRASVDYYLAKEADSVKIDILDSTGALVRSFEGSAEAEKKRQAAAAAAGGGDEEDGPRNPVRLPTRKAGANRFSWDLRYPGATSFEGLIMWGAQNDQGPLAVPGRYQVRLVVGGVSKTQPLTIERDPRATNISQADLEAQFKLAMQARDKTSEANEMVIRIREIKKSVGEKVKANASLQAAGERLTTHLSAVEEDLYQVRNRSNQDPLNFPIKLNNQLAALMRVIGTGDGRPTDQSYVVFQELSGRLDGIRQRMDQILREEMGPFGGAVK